MFKFLRIFLVLSIAMISMLIAATPTLYVCGVEDLARRTRHDTLNVETAAGSLSAYTAPSASINSLIIQFVGNAGVASSVLTTTTKVTPKVKNTKQLFLRRDSSLVSLSFAA